MNFQKVEARATAVYSMFGNLLLLCPSRCSKNAAVAAGIATSTCKHAGVGVGRHGRVRLAFSDRGRKPEQKSRLAHRSVCF